MTTGVLALSLGDMLTLFQDFAADDAVTETKARVRPARITERRIDPSFEISIQLRHRP